MKLPLFNHVWFTELAISYDSAKFNSLDIQ